MGQCSVFKEDCQKGFHLFRMACRSSTGNSREMWRKLQVRVAQQSVLAPAHLAGNQRGLAHHQKEARTRTPSSALKCPDPTKKKRIGMFNEIPPVFKFNPH